MSTDLKRMGRDKDALVATLHYVELGCSDPAKSASFYERALGYQLSKHEDAWIARGPDRRLVLLPGEARTLVSAGFAVERDELERLRERLQKAGCESVDGPTRLFTDSVSARDPDGNCYAFGLPAPEAQAASTGPQARLQHVVTASREPAPIVRFLVDVLGFSVTDKVLDDEHGVRTTFLRCSNEHHSVAVFQAAENRLDHHAYETAGWNDIRDWADHLAAEHIQIQWGPGRHGPGNNLFFFIHDADNNWIELSAELELIEHERSIGEWPHEHRTLNSWGLGHLRS